MDPINGSIPIELLNPSGKEDDFLCLHAEMPRSPGEILFYQCLERNVAAGTSALVIGNPSKDLSYARWEALRIASLLESSGFSQATTAKIAIIGDNATSQDLLQGMEFNPSVVYYSGHSDSLTIGECLVLASDEYLFADELLNRAKPFNNNPLERVSKLN